jgi:hypothetical protein
MNKPLNSICIIPKNECFFCVQCEVFINTDRCPVCTSQTIVGAILVDKIVNRNPTIRVYADDPKDYEGDRP